MKPVKALILGILLLVPILIFIFISVFGTHHFSLPTLYPKLDARGNVVVDAQGDTVFQQVPDFALTTLGGDTVTQADLEGKVYVVHFFGAACEDACQKIFSQLLRLQEVYANNTQLKLVSIGTSSAPESKERLRQQANEYKVQQEKWLLLTGDSSAVLPLAAGFHQPYQVLDGTITPSTHLVLVDKEKKIRGVYEGTDLKDVDRLKTEINVLLDEYSKRK